MQVNDGFMKTFREPLWKSVYAPSLIIWGIGFPAMVVSILLSLETWNDLLTFWTIFLSVTYVVLLFLNLRAFTYMTMDDTGCCFQNALFRWWRHAFRYTGIYSIKLIYAGGYTTPYIELCQKGTWRRRRFIISLVDETDYLPILDIFREKGVYVQTINIARSVKRAKLPL